MTPRTFATKVDRWLIAVMAGVLGAALLQGWLLRAISPLASGIVMGVSGLTVLLFIAVAVPCTYTLACDHLLIRSGLIRQKIAYKDITAVEPSTNPLSAPALSLKRVKVSYGRTFQLVSPRERDLFIQSLRERVSRVQAGL